jgi:hypothetical protein
MGRESQVATFVARFSLIGTLSSCVTPADFDEVQRGDDSTQGLRCGWVFPTHRKVADLAPKTGAARLFGHTLLASPVQGDHFFRVLATHDGVVGPMELYAVDTAAVGSSPAPELIGTREEPQQLLRLDASTTGILSASTGADAAGTVRLVLYRIADSDKPGAAAVLDPLLDTADLGGASRLSGRVSVTDSGSLSLITSFQAPSNEFRVALSRPHASPRAAPIVLASDADEDNVRERAMLEIGEETHVFIGTPQAPLGSRMFTVPRDAKAAPPARTISPLGSFLLTASLDHLGLLDVAFVDITAQVALKTGQVAKGDLASFRSADVPVAGTFGGLTDVPYTTVPQWVGDNFVALGATGIAGSELTIIWADAHGHLRAHQKLEKLAAGLKLGASAIAAQSQLGELGGLLDVVWVVTSVDAHGGEPYDVMYYDELRCL